MKYVTTPSTFESQLRSNKNFKRQAAKGGRIFPWMKNNPNEAPEEALAAIAFSANATKLYSCSRLQLTTLLGDNAPEPNWINLHAPFDLTHLEIPGNPKINDPLFRLLHCTPIDKFLEEPELLAWTKAEAKTAVEDALQSMFEIRFVCKTFIQWKKDEHWTSFPLCFVGFDKDQELYIKHAILPKTILDNRDENIKELITNAVGMASFFFAIFNSSGTTSSKTKILAPGQQVASTPKKRKKQNLKYVEHITVDLELGRREVEQSSPTAIKRGKTRRHMVKGYIRATGGVERYIKACARGDASLGIIHKDYRPFPPEEKAKWAGLNVSVEVRKNDPTQATV